MNPKSTVNQLNQQVLKKDISKQNLDENTYNQLLFTSCLDQSDHDKMNYQITQLNKKSQSFLKTPSFSDSKLTFDHKLIETAHEQNKKLRKILNSQEHYLMNPQNPVPLFCQLQPMTYSQWNSDQVSLGIQPKAFSKPTQSKLL